MIKVTILKHTDQYKGFIISGHAGYAEEGYDIICSAVSVLSINTANSIETLAHIPIRAEEEDGYLSCQFEKELNYKVQEVNCSLFVSYHFLLVNY